MEFQWLSRSLPEPERRKGFILHFILADQTDVQRSSNTVYYNESTDKNVIRQVVSNSFLMKAPCIPQNAQKLSLILCLS